MQHDKTYTDDLDYLSEAGFAQFEASAAEIEGLKQRVRERASAGGGAAQAAFVFVALGLFLATTVFCAAYNRETIYPTYADKPAAGQGILAESKVPDTIELDAVEVTHESFVRPGPGGQAAATTDPLAEATGTMDSLQVVELKPQDLPAANALVQGSEAGLRFLVNSGISYIHDLKISNYRTMYFKKPVDSSLGGVPASSVIYDIDDDRMRFKAMAYEYLHEEVSRAMLLFRKGKYDECSYVLTKIAEYNEGDVNCGFYLGMCNYYRKNYVQALANFDICLTSPNNAFKQEAEYYKALALDEMGKKEDARALLKQIAEDGYFYAAKAKALLSKGSE